MADDKDQDQSPEESEDFGALTGGGDTDSGMGNLPPLSDFDSTQTDSDGDLPPLDTPASEGDDEGPISGLPPIVDIKVDTPAVRPSDLDTPEPKKDEQAGADLPSPGGFDTPGDLHSPDPAESLGFQDFAADSDFSPETPEIGPGPDSDIETPMFDSAFGGDSDVFGTPSGTSAPTQAMETPMFDAGGTDSPMDGGMGFDADATFGGATPDVGGDTGTPVPDFSPDTGVPQEMGQVPVGAGPPRKKGSKLVSFLLFFLVAVLFLAAGLFASPFAREYISVIPNPDQEVIDEKDGIIAERDETIRILTSDDVSTVKLTPEQINAMIADRDRLQGEIDKLEAQANGSEQKLADLSDDLENIQIDIEAASGDFVAAQEQLDEVTNDLTISRAQFDGLSAETTRLTEMVGELEQADERRKSTKDTLLHNVDLLTVQVDGGSPLTPERYSYYERVERVKVLKDKIQRAKWVTPQLLNEYTDLYLDELEISNAREFFFAKIPVHDRLDEEYDKWAECLMNGNWSVYYRTLDGRHIGSYENTAGTGPAQYEFREELPASVRNDIINAIEASRPEGYDETVKFIKEKQKIYETDSKFQKNYSSLR